MPWFVQPCLWAPPLLGPNKWPPPVLNNDLPHSNNASIPPPSGNKRYRSPRTICPSLMRELPYGRETIFWLGVGRFKAVQLAIDGPTFLINFHIIISNQSASSLWRRHGVFGPGPTGGHAAHANPTNAPATWFSLCIYIDISTAGLCHVRYSKVLSIYCV